MRTASELEIIKQEIEYLSGIPNIAKETRKPEVVIAKSIFIKTARERTGYSMEVIGGVVNVKHSTVTHSLKNLQRHLGNYPVFQRIYDKMNGGDTPIEYHKLHQELVEVRKKLSEASKKIKNLERGKVSPSHKELYELVEKVPDYHVGTVAQRLKPILLMLEKPSRYNNLHQKQIA